MATEPIIWGEWNLTELAEEQSAFGSQDFEDDDYTGETFPPVTPEERAETEAWLAAMEASPMPYTRNTFGA
jgi:hypothetical protein